MQILNIDIRIGYFLKKNKSMMAVSCYKQKGDIYFKKSGNSKLAFILGMKKFLELHENLRR